MNTVNKDMRDAEKNLAGLEKCCGLCSCPWQKVLTLLVPILAFLMRTSDSVPIDKLLFFMVILDKIAHERRRI